jgi:hypothetical protein
MTLEQSILDLVRNLSAEKRTELMSFLERLQAAETTTPLQSGYGLAAHLGFRISAEEIDEARREMWKDCPRDDI